MITAATLHRARVPLVAIVAFGLGVLAAMSYGELRIGNSISASPSTPIIARTAPAPAKVAVRADARDSCGRSAYVTGDMVGDASPTSVYATLCPR